MKDKIKQIKEWLENNPYIAFSSDINVNAKMINDCIQDLGLSNEWVSEISAESVDIGKNYLWYTPSGHATYCKAVHDGLLSNPDTGDEDFWPYSANLVGKLYGQLPPSEAKS